MRRDPRRVDRAEQAGLWRDRSFQLLWLGQTTATAGGQIRMVVLPVVMYQLTGSATLTALVLTVQAAPYLIFGLVAGAVADRANRRTIMVGCDLVSVVAMASIPLTAVLGALTPAQIFVAGVATGTAFVWHDSALFGALPAIVGRDRVAGAYGIFISTSQVLQVSATAAAGVLIATVGAQHALWIDAGGYLLSAVMIYLVPRNLRATVAADAHRPAGLVADIGEGLRFVRRHPIIWPLTATGLGSGLAGGAVTGLIVIYGVRQLGLADDDARLGWLFTALAVGGLAGGLALPVLSRRVNQPLITLVGLTISVALLISLALQASVVAALVLLGGWGATSTLIIANGITLRQQLTPDRLQGRVNVTARMIAAGGVPLGAAIAGVLADQLDVRAALLVMMTVLVGAAVYAWSSSLRRVDRTTIARMQDEAEQTG